MLRTAWVLVLLAGLGGCAGMEQGPTAGGGWGGGLPTSSHASSSSPMVPGVQGPWGQPVAMAAPYSASPPGGGDAARAMMARSIPMDMLQVGATANPGGHSGLMLAGGPGAGPPSGTMSPAGLPFQPMTPGMSVPPPGAVAAVGALSGSSQGQFPTKRTEVRFVGPPGMRVSWFGAAPDGRPVVASHLEAPGRYNFVQGAIYRLKLSDVPGRPGLELYPTLEVVPSNARSDTFLAHSAVPVAFTDEDFDQVALGNYVVKVVYLPDPQFQDLAIVGPDELVSTRLPPGADPIAEAYRRGSILLVVRLGNIDLEAPGTPAMNAPSPYTPNSGHGPAMGGHGMAPGPQMPPMGMPQMPGMSAGRFMGPNGPMMNGPDMPPNGSAPPAGVNGQAPPAVQQQSLPAGPVSTQPYPGMIQQMQYNGTAAKAATTAAMAAGQTPDPSSTSTDKKPAASRHWWWPGDSTNKQ
jgi:hypothetical protein